MNLVLQINLQQQAKAEIVKALFLLIKLRKVSARGLCCSILYNELLDKL